jgi:DNA-binding CsgD family transcriptional regulator
MTPSAEEIPSPLLASLYGVLDDQKRWSEFLHGFCGFVGTAYASVLSLTFGPDPRLRSFFWWGLSDEDVREYQTYWAGRDPWVKGKDLSGQIPGAVAGSVDFCPDDQLEVNEFYLGFLKPRNLHYGARAVLFKRERVSTILSTLRSKDPGRLTVAELDRMRSLVPHLQRVLRIQGETGDLATERDLLSGLFDQTAIGLVLLDQSGAVLAANSSARAVMDRGELLFTENGLLRSPCKACDRALQEAIHHALHRFEKTPGGEAVSLGQQSLDSEAAGPRLRLLVGPAHHRGTRDPSPVSPAVMVHIVDPAAPPHIDREMLRRVFSLSRAEAAVAEKLACGLSVAGTAGSLHVSHHTVRSHIKNLFLKTGTAQQSALVSLILRLQAPLLGTRSARMVSKQGTGSRT